MGAAVKKIVSMVEKKSGRVYVDVITDIKATQIKETRAEHENECWNEVKSLGIQYSTMPN